MEIVFATSNAHKAAEIQRLLPSSINVKTLKDIGCEEDIPETADTVEGNALQKANYVMDHYQTNCFADDTALEVDALNGEPGVYSARYAGPQRSAEDNMQLLLSKLEGKENRSARFRTVIALILEGKEYTFEGIVEGKISLEKSGSEGFGYDPIFIPNDYSVSFSEMSMEEKNSISHRGRAVRKLVEFLKNYSS
ncbi:MAG: non-canonical purine NTP diphosphatase [Flavobacteriales bacterium]|nr:non-canonical purine NTP diphosphatase [Flavobacteriales bacterium]